MAQGSIMELKITLHGEMTWRTVLVANSIRYDELHGLIQLLFGWHNLHLHQFDVPATSAQYRPELDDDDNDVETFVNEATKFAYSDLQRGHVTYTYDMEQLWHHDIELERNWTMAQFTKAGYLQVPFCIAGNGTNLHADEPAVFDQDDINAQFRAISDGWFSLN